MTETTGLPPAPDAPPAWPPPPPPPPPNPNPTPPWPRRPIAATHLVRSNADRVLAGVAGGVGRRLGIDPLILRLLLVVLAFFGGAGILLYAVGWLLLPLDDGRGRSLIENGFDAGVPGRARNLLTVACLVVVIGVSGLLVLSTNLAPALLVIGTVVAVFLYARRDTGTPAGAYAYGDAGPTPSPYGVSSGAPDPAASWPPPPAPADPTGSYSGTEPTVAYAGGPPAPPLGAPVVPFSTPPPEPPRQRRERSYLGPLTISVATVGLGVLAAVDAAWADLPGAAYIFSTLAIVALGLVIGTWYGRSRGLIVLGILLCAALVPATVLDTATDDDWSQLSRWNDGETVRAGPLTPDEVQPTYDIGIGRLVLDLREVDFAGAEVATSLLMGAGEVLVLIPEDVNVTATGTVDLGELELLGARSGGVDADADISDLGGAGTAGGELYLMIDVNVGRAEVRREAA